MKLLALLAVLSCATPAALGAQVERFELLASDGADSDLFGGRVAISGTTAIVGAEGKNGRAGAAYLFDTTTGVQIAKLVAEDSEPLDRFGRAVAIQGDIAVVGAPQRGYGPWLGSVYLFDATTGVQLAKLLPRAGTASAFGAAVAISGHVLVVGAPRDDVNGAYSGSAYLFDVTTGEPFAKLVSDDGAPADNFGYSVGISGNTVIVGAWGNHENGFQAGAAYLFDASLVPRPGISDRRRIAKLLPRDGQAFEGFGRSVAISGATAIVGAPGALVNGGRTGCAYLFDTTFDREIKLLVKEARPTFGIGGHVAIDGNRASVSGQSFSGTGPVYLFDVSAARSARDRKSAFEVASVEPNDGVFNDSFDAHAISGSALVVGADGHDHVGNNAGAAYVFALGAHVASRDGGARKTE